MYPCFASAFGALWVYFTIARKQLGNHHMDQQFDNRALVRRRGHMYSRTSSLDSLRRHKSGDPVNLL